MFERRYIFAISILALSIFLKGETTFAHNVLPNSCAKLFTSNEIEISKEHLFETEEAYNRGQERWSSLKIDTALVKSPNGNKVAIITAREPNLVTIKHISGTSYSYRALGPVSGRFSPDSLSWVMTNVPRILSNGFSARVVEIWNFNSQHSRLFSHQLPRDAQEVSVSFKTLNNDQKVIQIQYLSKENGELLESNLIFDRKTGQFLYEIPDIRDSISD